MNDWLNKMRITHELLQVHSSFPIEEAQYIDLSRQDIVIIEQLSFCRGLRSLILSGNIIKEIQNVDCCRQLWNLDVSGNRVKSLCGLSRFPVLGSVSLGGNELDWQELHRISHITILNLSLIGNPKLDSDPHYRCHVVDMLPNVWMLDGRLVTASERKKVEEFFNESESLPHPVRRKGSGKVFIPTTLKNLLVNGVFGDKTAHMMSRFPVSYIHNAELDKKRLSYLVYSIEEDMKLATFHHFTHGAANCLPLPSEPHDKSSKWPQKTPPDLQSLFDHREKEVEQCNMLLLLMLAALEYSIPLEVLQATLETAKLAVIGDIRCNDLFMMPRSMILDVASLLLSAATVDRLSRKEGGLYSQLYKSMCHTMDSVQVAVKCDSRKTGSTLKRAGDSKNHAAWSCLLASEVVHLMCLVPQFFDSIQVNEGLMRMTAIATKRPDVSEVISKILLKVQYKGGDVWEVYQDIASYLLQATTDNVSNRRKRHPTERSPLHKTTSQLLHPTQPKVSPRLLRTMSAGVASRAVSKRCRSARTEREPEVGDMVVTSTEQVARIVALLESRTAMLQVNTISSEQPDAYLYADTSTLMWNNQFKYWTRDPLAADFSSNSHLSDSLSCATLPTLASITSLHESTGGSRAATPEHGAHRWSRSRPLSGRSEDLQTIPSQEELIEGVQGERVTSNNSSPRSMQTSPIRVDFGPTSLSVTSVTSESDHQHHVLQQYSLNQLRTHEQQKNQSSVDISPRSRALRNLQKSTKEAEQKRSIKNEDLSVPTPQLQLAKMWESDKSVPTVPYNHFKPHSCGMVELDKQNLRVEPSMTPTPAVLPPSPPLHRSPLHSDLNSDLLANDISKHGKPVMYNAWTAARPIAPTKHSTSTRQVHKHQPKTPPVRAQMNGTGHSGFGTYAVLRSKPQEQTRTVQQRKDSHSGKVLGKYHYHYPKAARVYTGTSVRKLGKTKTPDFFIENVSTRTS